MYSFFFFNDTATTEIYTLSLHDALPICRPGSETHNRIGACEIDLVTSTSRPRNAEREAGRHSRPYGTRMIDRKSTRLNSSHANISYAVFCLKKKKNSTVSTHRASMDYHV